MKIRHWKYGIAVLFTSICSFASFAQITPELLQKYVSKSKDTGNAEIMKFYVLLDYQTAWIQSKNTVNRDVLLSSLKTAPGLGLRETDYQDEFITSIRKDSLKLQNAIDSIVADIRLTAIALHFYSDLAYGNVKPPLGYDGLNYVPGCYDIPALMSEYSAGNILQLLPFRLSSSLPEITAMESKLRYFNTILSDSHFREVVITSPKVNGANQPLVNKLYQLGLIDTLNFTLPDSILKQKVKEAQKHFALFDDGVLRSTIIQQLNIPLSTRFQQLSVSLNYYRWLGCIAQEQSVINVNIPAAYLKLYRQNKVALEMRMVVGKLSTPTPTLTSKVREVILYPYWHVPNAIATKELLPKIKRNAAFINEGNYQVLNRAGKIIDPYSVNWQALNRNNFPYLIRQSTGCDNALGLIKLNFYNPFDVYLHDTPGKNSFQINKRFLSHGCMRMEKPMELGRLVLKNNTIAIDTLEQKGCLRNQAPILVPAREQLPVIVWYNPAGIDSNGRVLFFEDIYEKFSWMKNK